jgi:CRISP-associated protein Cas1
MSFINIFLSSDSMLSIKDNCLVLKNEFKEVSYPIEDVNSIMCENLMTNFTSYTLSLLSTYNVLIYFCDNKHLPNSILLPYNKFYKPLELFNYQISMPKPLEKKLWQTIIINKINNQAKVVKMLGLNDEKLKNFSKQVLSGDSRNIEAKASLLYFKEIFNNNFKRREDNIINACLNYGYSVLRGAFARSIVSHGLLSFLGIFHKNQFDSFCLADDLMEIIRPIIDLFVVSKYKYLLDTNKFGTDIKSQILNLLNNNVLIDNCKQPLLYGIEIYIESFVTSIKLKTNSLKYLEILELETHEYE